MLALRPGLGLKVVQDHFLEALVLVLRYLVLVLNGGLGQDQDHHSRPWLDHAIGIRVMMTTMSLIRIPYIDQHGEYQCDFLSNEQTNKCLANAKRP